MLHTHTHIEPQKLKAFKHVFIYKINIRCLKSLQINLSEKPKPHSTWFVPCDCLYMCVFVCDCEHKDVLPQSLTVST